MSPEQKHIRKVKRKNRRKLILAVIIAGVLMFFAVFMGLTTFLMRSRFTRVDYPDKKYSYNYRYSHYASKYPREEVTFLSGHNTLHGYIYGMDNDKGLIVFAHGIGAGHESYMPILISMVDKGWRVFAYDATGSCSSEGSSTIGLAQSAIDLDKALTYAESDDRLNELPMFVMGHSWGGYASAAVLNFDHDIKACVTLSGYCTPMKELNEASELILGSESAKYLTPFIWLYNKACFRNYSDLSAVDGINKSNIPVMVVHGTSDKTVRYDGAAIINQQSKITNEKVVYVTMDEKRRRGHNSYLYSKKTVNYMRKKLDPQFELMMKQYNGKIPNQALAAYYRSVNKKLANGINTELFDQVDEFFTQQLEPS
ncbi:Alpha/beta hydrolase family protein [Ruminococcus sp. YE71]|nr:alpha/beta fold hydrolase [Ruminococcus sp. YE78]SDA27766.1 Alpha/beta hydrolase family protein [Ruminococcus sp. YE78]SFW46122.1 Alpha/beta hydrolase family protein [Ruminococcus sp. YE71]